MQQVSLAIVNKLGLHARAASKLVTVAKQHVSTIEIGPSDDQLVNGKSIMQLMTLTAAQGTELVLRVDGEDEEAATSEIVSLVADYFGEGE